LPGFKPAMRATRPGRRRGSCGGTIGPVDTVDAVRGSDVYGNSATGRRARRVLGRGRERGFRHGPRHGDSERRSRRGSFPAGGRLAENADWLFGLGKCSGRCNSRGYWGDVCNDITIISFRVSGESWSASTDFPGGRLPTYPGGAPLPLLRAMVVRRDAVSVGRSPGSGCRRFVRQHHIARADALDRYAEPAGLRRGLARAVAL
jgi:hypothetical protein